MSNSENKKFGIDELIENEKKRNREERSALANEIEQLPKGSLCVRAVNGRKYCYLRYREGARIVTNYAGTIKKQLEIQKLLEKRQKIIDQIKALDAEYERMEKMEAMK